MVINITQKSLSDQVYDHIKSMILSGELKGGERVPETQLSNLFGVSRTPLREALKKLSEYGLVYLKPRSFAEVAIIDEEEAKQIAEVRLNLEILSATLLAKNGSESVFQELKELSNSCLQAAHEGHRSEAFELDSKFHLTIAEKSGNKVLYDIYERLDARIQLLRLNQNLIIESLQDYIKQHSRLLEAMKNGEIRLLTSILSKHIIHDFH